MAVPFMRTGKTYLRVCPHKILHVLTTAPHVEGLAVAELCAASVLEHITLPSPRSLSGSAWPHVVSPVQAHDVEAV